MTDRVAFVTGGAQGIGGGISEALGAQGFRVAVADLNLDAAKETAQRIVDDIAARWPLRFATLVHRSAYVSPLAQSTPSTATMSPASASSMSVRSSACIRKIRLNRSLRPVRWL